MSLHTLANHLQSAGRGEDKVLVHMTPGEVNGLQSLAMAHGGSLTINPETGLPEAGFLKSLLPTLAGLGLSFIPGVGPMMAASIVGGGTAVATGSLTKGLMAGLGAYSGAGMGAGLKAMGTPAVEAAGQGLNTASAGQYGLQNTGASIGLRAPGATPTSTLGVDMANAGFKNPVLDAGFKNPVLDATTINTVPVADASNILGTDATNKAVLGKLGYTGSGSLPVAGAKPVPFSEGFPSGNSVVHTVDPSLAPRPDTYFTPRDSSGVIRGASGQAGKPITTIPNTGGAHSGSYSGVGDNVLIQSNRPVLNIAQTSPLDEALVDSNVARGLSGSPPAGMGPYDKSIMSNVAPRGETVIAKDLPPIESRTGAVPIERRTLLEKPVNYRRSEILPGDPPLAQPRSLSAPFREHVATMGRGAEASFGSLEGLKGLYAATEAAAPYATYAGLGSTAYSMYDEKRQRMEDEMRARAAANQGLIRPYTFSYGTGNVSSQPYYGSAERTYFQPTYTELPSYKAPGPEYAAKGGLMSLAVGGPVEEMAAMNEVGANTGYPMAALQTPMYSNPAMQRPEATNVIAPSADAGVTTYSGEQRFRSGGTTEPQSSGYSYDYNPNTMQFTQTGGPGVSKVPTGQELAQGIGAMDMQKRFNEMAITGRPYNFTPSFMSGAASNNAAYAGTPLPVSQPAAPAQSFIPNINIPAYQTPEQQLGLGGFYDYMNQQMGGYGGYAAGGGVSHLGDYSDGGRLLKGPGDGVSDSIPASIGNRQPARLADGEFVIPARIVSEIGNGSTDAGARKLYAMMDRIQKARRKTVGKEQVAKDTRAEKLLPA